MNKKSKMNVFFFFFTSNRMIDGLIYSDRLKESEWIEKKESINKKKKNS